MRKLLLFMASIILLNSVNAQEKKDSSRLSTTLFSGGVWSGFNPNERLNIIGLLGPKLSITFPMNPKTKIETGFMGVPGIIIDNGVSKLGLSFGVVVIVKVGKAKMKPVLGCMLIKTDKWHPVYGIGIQF